MESGHEKNVANFKTVIIILTALGSDYNPTQTLILLTALQAKLVLAETAIAEVNEAEADRAVKVDDFEAEIEDLDKYVVNIKRTAEVAINDEAFTRDLQTVVNKFFPEGRQTGLPDDPNTPEDESRTARSTSQRSYDNQIAYLADILALIQTKAELYKTNDERYTIAAIEAKLAALREKYTASKTALAVLGTKKDARDEILYHPETGVLKLVTLIKKQLTLSPGKNSTAYQQVNDLEFAKPRP